jgi:hypothetical protein
VGTFTFTAPAAGFALVTARFAVRVRNSFDSTQSDCRVESQLAAAPAVLGYVSTGSPGFIDQWVNGNLPTENGGGTYLGLNMSGSRVFPVVAGSNTLYLNGQYNGYGAGPNCLDALWAPISFSALFADQNPAATLTTP